jgi:hypothetical protein
MLTPGQQGVVCGQSFVPASVSVRQNAFSQSYAAKSSPAIVPVIICTWERLVSRELLRQEAVYCGMKTFQREKFHPDFIRRVVTFGGAAARRRPMTAYPLPALALAADYDRGHKPARKLTKYWRGTGRPSFCRVGSFRWPCRPIVCSQVSVKCNRPGDAERRDGWACVCTCPV